VSDDEWKVKKVKVKNWVSVQANGAELSPTAVDLQGPNLNGLDCRECRPEAPNYFIYPQIGFRSGQGAPAAPEHAPTSDLCTDSALLLHHAFPLQCTPHQQVYEQLQHQYLALSSPCRRNQVQASATTAADHLTPADLGAYLFAWRAAGASQVPTRMPRHHSAA
jgi:hypothetical protein